VVVREHEIPTYRDLMYPTLLAVADIVEAGE